MNSTFYTAIVPLAAPVTVQVRASQPFPRPRIISGDEPQETEPLTLVELDVAFWIAPITKTIHAQIAHIPVPLLIYGSEDFGHVVTDTTEHHSARLLQILGENPAQVLQAAIDGTPLSLPPRVPREIAAWRAKAVLEIAGLLPQVEALITAMPEPAGTVVRRAWHDNAPLERQGQTVLSLSSSLNLSDEQLDAMFIQAASLQI